MQCPQLVHLCTGTHISLIFALRRQILSYRNAIANGAWERSPGCALLLTPIPQALAGSRMGIVGFGKLANQVAMISEASGMEIMIAERKGRANAVKVVAPLKTC